MLFVETAAHTGAVQIPSEFFTLQSMLTLTGASGATFVVCNGLQRAFDFNPRWLALLVAQIVVIVGTHLSHTGGVGLGDYFVAVLNGFLVYATAAGTTHILGGPSEAPAVARGAREVSPPSFGSRRRFLSPWF